MAYVISKENHLEASYKGQRKCFWWALGLGLGLVAFWFLYIFASQRPDIWLVIGCPVIVFGLLFFAKTRYHKLSVLAAGIRGEKMALDALKTLDSEHWIVTDKEISHKGLSSELDFVVIGPTGVCIVECKHLAGKIFADPNAKNWVQRKVSHSGVEREKTFYSPMKQVNTHLYRLKKLLQEEGISVHLDCAVFFPDPESQVILESKSADTPVFWGEKGKDLLLSYIRKPRHPLTPQEVLKITEILHNQ